MFSLIFFSKNKKVKAIISTGPFLQPDQIRSLRQKVRGLPVSVEDLEEDAIYFMKRADLLVSMAGYNTTCEIMRFRKNAIIIPRPGPSAEQTIRTNIFASTILSTPSTWKLKTKISSQPPK